MKKTICTLFSALFLTVTAWAQSPDNAIRNFYPDYRTGEDVTSVSITGKLFSMMADVEVDDQEAQEMVDFFSSITSIEVLMTDPGFVPASQFEQGRKRLPKRYEELMTIDDTEGHFDFRIVERSGVVEEVFLIAGVEERMVLVSILGDLDIRQVGRIAKEIQMEGFEQMGKMEDYDLEEWKVYPNPVSKDASLWVEIPEEYLNGQALIYDVNGRQVMQYPIGARKQQVQVNKLKAGTYIMEIQHEGSKLSRTIEVTR